MLIFFIMQRSLQSVLIFRLLLKITVERLRECIFTYFLLPRRCSSYWRIALHMIMWFQWRIMYGGNSILRRTYMNTLKKVIKYTNKIHHFDLDMSYATHVKIIELHQARRLEKKTMILFKTKTSWSGTPSVWKPAGARRKEENI